MSGARERCGNVPCVWCDRDDWACRFCAGGGSWRPERPRLGDDGVIGWERIAEPCRMCAGTGKEHNPPAGRPPT